MFRASNVRREVVRKSQGMCFNNIHPLNLELGESSSHSAAARASLPVSMCQGQDEIAETASREYECLEPRVVGTAGVDY
jgi:hypothetical protein